MKEYLHIIFFNDTFADYLLITTFCPVIIGATDAPLDPSRDY